MYSYEQEATYAAASPTFISKVIFCFALGIFSSLVGFIVGAQYLMPYFAVSPLLMWGAFLVELGLIFTSGMWSTKRPLNYFLFAAFTFITGVTIVPLILVIANEFGGYSIITKALLTTILMFTAAALLGSTTKYNLAGIRGFLGIGLIGMIIIGLIGLFIPWSNNFEIIFSGAGVVLFSAFAMYDIQKLKAYPEDRYIDAALALYLDIFNLFIFLIRLISSLNRN